MALGTGAAEGSAPELQRVSGVAWQSAAQLAEWKRRSAEAARRDHRVLGPSLDLFTVGHPVRNFDRNLGRFDGSFSIFWHI